MYKQTDTWNETPGDFIMLLIVYAGAIKDFGMGARSVFKDEAYTTC